MAEHPLFAGVDFLLSAGDQVNTANNEEQYNGYLGHAPLSHLPMATVIGNHDASSNAYDQHFNVPNESALGKTNAGGDYWFVYNNTLFMALNSSNMSTAEHKAFMEQAIAQAGEVDWKIVTFHHSVYSVASHAVDGDILQRREELVPVLDQLDIDVVLMGHDHVYVRTYIMDGLTPVTQSEKYTDTNKDSIPESVTDPDGTLYVTANSASGSKYYNIQDIKYDYSAVQNQERVPNISRVDVSKDAFTVTTYRTSDMSVVDTFTIRHTAEIQPTPQPPAQPTPEVPVTPAPEVTPTPEVDQKPGDQVPQTGDTAVVAVYIVALVAAAAALFIGVAVVKRHRRQH